MQQRHVLCLFVAPIWQEICNCHVTLMFQDRCFLIVALSFAATMDFNMNDGQFSQSGSPYPPASRSSTPYSVHSGSASDHSLPSFGIHQSRSTTPYSHHGSLPASGSDLSLPGPVGLSFRTDLTNFRSHNSSERWSRTSSPARSSSSMSSNDELRERIRLLEADNLVLRTENGTLKSVLS